MSTGRLNRLAGQIGEHLVCAELGRRELIATSFARNVPTFGVLAVDESGRTVPIQVMASRSDNWPSQATRWMQLQVDTVTGRQTYAGLTQLTTPDLIWVCVAIAKANSQNHDRFFILTEAD